MHLWIPLASLLPTKKDVSANRKFSPSIKNSKKNKSSLKKNAMNFLKTCKIKHGVCHNHLKQPNKNCRNPANSPRDTKRYLSSSLGLMFSNVIFGAEVVNQETTCAKKLEPLCPSAVGDFFPPPGLLDRRIELGLLP